MSSNDKQVGGSHYKAEFQHWDWALALNLPYITGNITKYIYRWRKKNGLQDLQKALHYLEKQLEEETIHQDEMRALTCNFLQSNAVGEQEQAIVRCLVDFHLGKYDYLKVAHGILTQLIEDQLNTSSTIQ
jgi:hypothetical protein